MTTEQIFKELTAQLTNRTLSFSEYAALVQSTSALLTTAVTVDIESQTCSHTFSTKTFYTDPAMIHTVMATPCPLCTPPELVDGSEKQIAWAEKVRAAAVARHGSLIAPLVTSVRGAKYWIVPEIIAAFEGEPGNSQVRNLVNNLGVTGFKVRELVNDLSAPGQVNLTIETDDPESWTEVVERFEEGTPAGQTPEEIKEQAERNIKWAMALRIEAEFLARPSRSMVTEEILLAAGRPTKYRYPVINALRSGGKITTSALPGNGRKFLYTWHEVPVSEPENPHESKRSVTRRLIKEILNATNESLTRKEIMALDKSHRITEGTFGRAVADLEDEGYLTSEIVRVGGLAGIVLYYTRVVTEGVNGE